MEVRTATARTARRTPLTIVGWAILTLFVSAAISACTPGSTSTSVFVPAASGSVTVTTSVPTSTFTFTAPAPATHTTTAPPAPEVRVTVTVTPPPAAAPATGGGGTAGLQDGVLFAIGAAAILVGVGSVIYRRKLTKDR